MSRPASASRWLVLVAAVAAPILSSGCQSAGNPRPPGTIRRALRPNFAEPTPLPPRNLTVGSYAGFQYPSRLGNAPSSIGLP